MRLLLLIVCLPVMLAAQDARQIVVRAIDAYRKDSEIARSYTFVQHEVDSDLDGAGKPRHTENRTWEVSMQEGSPYRRLLARDDKPISAEEAKLEGDRLQWNIEQRRKETPEQRERRVSEWKRREARRTEPLKELPDAFEFRIAREETVNGAAAWLIEATPKPGYQPKSTAASFFPKVSLRLWIDKREYQCAKAEMETQGTVSFGGFVVRVAKGGHLMLENTRVANDVWLPKRFTMEAQAKVMLVKGYHKALDITYGEYKKVGAEPRATAAEAR